MIEILKRLPSELSNDDFQTFNLRELIIKGYDYSGDESFLNKVVRDEYTGDDEMRTIYLGLINKQAVGSLVMSLWLKDQADPFHDSAKRENLNIYGMHGTVTHPDYRRLRVSRQLIEEFLKDKDPDVIVGRTKTPEAVLARANTVARFGYRTFYMHHEVTNSDVKTGETTIHKPFLDGYCSGREVVLDDMGVSYVSTRSLLPNVPDLAPFPEYIVAPFERIIKAQTKIGTEKTAVLPLLSIKSSLL